MPNYHRHITRKQVERALAFAKARYKQYRLVDDRAANYWDGKISAYEGLLLGEFADEQS